MKINIKTPIIKHSLLSHVTDPIFNIEYLSFLEEKINYTNFYPNLKNDFTDFLNNGVLPENLQNELFSYGNKKDILFDSFLFGIRHQFTQKFGFTLLTENLITTLTKQFENKTVVDLGAGSGWLSKTLQTNGVNITPVDLKTTNNDYGFSQLHTNIINENAVNHLKNNSQYDAILLSWPNYDSPFAHQVLQELKPGQMFYYVGEGLGGCTANDDFFQLLKTKTKINHSLTKNLQKNQTSWSGIHDSWHVYTIIN